MDGTFYASPISHDALSLELLPWLYTYRSPISLFKPRPLQRILRLPRPQTVGILCQRPMCYAIRISLLHIVYTPRSLDHVLARLSCLVHSVYVPCLPERGYRMSIDVFI